MQKTCEFHSNDFDVILQRLVRVRWCAELCTMDFMLRLEDKFETAHYVMTSQKTESVYWGNAW
jgi:hypothetical protein